jgi:glycosyltransferase involved in cell wall biosynthesis
MRIAHVTTGDGGTPGTEKQLEYLAIAQKTGGADVMIAVDRPGNLTDSCRRNGIPVTITADLATGPGPEKAPEPADVQDLVAGLREFGADVIHCHSSRAGLLGILVSNQMDIPCFVMGDRVAGDRQVPMIPAKGSVNRTIICLSEAGYQELRKTRPEVPAFFVPNGSKCASPASAGQSGPAGPAGPVSLVYAGQLIPRKAVDIAILAMVELRRRRGQECPPFNIHGDGGQRKYLTEMTAMLNLNDVVRFHGFQNGILDRCSRGDILVMPSRSEVGPMVVLEAMSRGMPIVATDVGEVARMLPDRRHGRVIPPGSVPALADAIESMLDDLAAGIFDPRLVIERHRREYSIEKMAERIDAIYRQVLANEPTSA